MSPSTRAALQGATAALPMLLALIPFGVIFGALAAAAGMGLAATLGMTSIVVAGAAQLAALQLMTDGAPALVAVATAAVVNLRMAMYSASVATHWRGASLKARLAAAFVLFDMSYGLAIRRYAERPSLPLDEKLGFYFGAGGVCLVVWIAATLAGALLGARVPPEWGLSVAPALVFLSVAAPFLRARPHLAAAGVAAGVALLGAGLPYGLGLTAGAAAGIGAGLLAESAPRRRRA